jgi:hypothetical protein
MGKKNKMDTKIEKKLTGNVTIQLGKGVFPLKLISMGEDVLMQQNKIMISIPKDKIKTLVSELLKIEL